MTTTVFALYLPDPAPPSGDRSTHPVPPGGTHLEGHAVTEHQVLARVRDESTDPANPPATRLRDILQNTRRIAVVGVSRDPTKAARRVPSYLATKGYELIPVNPNAGRILGRAARARLGAVTEPVDLVLVFRPSDEAGAIVEEAAERPEKPVIWLQEGIRADEAVARARGRGLSVVQDLCIFKAHRSLDLSTGPIAPGPVAGRSPPPPPR